MNRVSLKLAILLIASSILPMLIYGITSVITSRQANFSTVIEGNLSTARRAADQIDQYTSNSISILKALSENISKSDLKSWQIERMFKNYLLEFDRFKEISLFGLDGRAIATSRFDKKDVSAEGDEARDMILKEGIYRSEVFISEELLPIMIIGLPIKRLGEIDGYMVARLNLVDIWDLVDGIKIGEEGYAFVVSKKGKLLAHGSGNSKPDVLKGIDLSGTVIVQSIMDKKEGQGIYKNTNKIEVLGVSIPIRPLGWGLVIEQPTGEAFKTAKKLAKKLAIGSFFVLFLMIGIGYLGGRWQIMRPINELIRGIRGVSGGDLDTRVAISTGDEFERLGDSFNMMAGRLKDLEGEIRANERSVFFGRIAAGLVHDLRHPVKNIENMSRLLTRVFNDEGYRENFKKTVERELGIINRFLDDLHNLTHPKPLAIIGIGLDGFIDEAIKPFEEEMARSRIELKGELSDKDMKISADRFALERIFKNLITNAIDAMPEGGILTIRTISCPNNVILEIIDTGIGIERGRLPFLFTDYQTTKKKGLGLGLPTTKRLMEEMGGSISADSIKGRGSRFILAFPHFTAQ